MQRSSGVLMPIFALPGAYSTGDFGAGARAFVDRLAEGGFSYWQVLPFCLPDEHHSPYKSYSTFSGNPYFIDLEALFEAGLLTAEELRSARQDVPYTCEYERLDRERLPLLFRAAARVQDRAPIERFAAEHREVDDFCRFMALKQKNGGVAWQDFTETEPDPEVLFAWRFLQYEFFRQWRELRSYAASHGIKLIGDIPIYVADDSSDVMYRPWDFQLDDDGHPRCVAGVPPDYFCEEGQLWGNPLYDWKRMKQDGYAFWRSRLSFMLSLFDGVRLDHFRAFESYFSVPRGAKSAKEGKWVKGPGRAFLKAMKDLTDPALLIAEDLGDITPAVEALVRASGFPPMRVLQFAFLGDPKSVHLPHHYPANCVAYTGTHDNNTLLGYVWEMPESERGHLMRYCGHDPADWNRGYDAILRCAMASHADLLILPIQDILLYGADTRFNTPGRAEGNWCYRITAEQLASADFEKFLSWNRLFGRI